MYNLAEDLDGLRALQKEEAVEEFESQTFGHVRFGSTKKQQSCDGRVMLNARVDGRRRFTSTKSDRRYT